MNQQPLAETPQRNEYRNPVYRIDFPDCCVLKEEGGYFAFASQGNRCNIQRAHSPDLVHWEPLPDALPKKSLLAPEQDYWAPDVVRLDTGQYRMFFNAKVKVSGQGIFVAMATSPEESFSVVGEPLTFQERYFDIDAKPFHDPQTGKWYLVWGSCYAPIRIKELRDDLLRFLRPDDSPTLILTPDPQNETTKLYEAPWMTARFDLQRNKWLWYLFTSGPDAFGDRTYGVQVARSEKGPLTGFETLAEATGVQDSYIYKSSSAFINPGACSTVTDDAGQDWLISHAVVAEDIPDYETLHNDPKRFWHELRYNIPRVMIIDKLHYTEDGWPFIENGHPSKDAWEGPSVYVPK